jgi:hypothetical protein
VLDAGEVAETGRAGAPAVELEGVDAVAGATAGATVTGAGVAGVVAAGVVIGGVALTVGVLTVGTGRVACGVLPVGTVTVTGDTLGVLAVGGVVASAEEARTVSASVSRMHAITGRTANPADGSTAVATRGRLVLLVTSLRDTLISFHRAP